ncbi:PLP-dependent transferase [Setomelanomma holmii]|uniref:PLP-dependent transferase n=1 Tax=Setomelanomma holmii TaxID=210430 RepID=A0A9P4H9H7_9PLEO|nr:PLP-dependent transferase [Setomelanomma holmii]
MGFRVTSRQREGTQTLEKERLAYNRRVARLRRHEYPMLKDVTYLDHGGTTLASNSLLDSFSKEMQSTLMANPHSDASNPSASSVIVAETRSKVLEFFNADPDHFDVIFTANATAGAKLVMECFSDLETGFGYYYHRNCHTSLVGIREAAILSHCLASDEETERWLDGEHDPLWSEEFPRPQLFAYSAQSNMNGQRLPLHLPNRLRKSARHPNTYTLLDAAALVSTSPLDLSKPATAPDFTILSLYKIFGFPDLGALIVRSSSSHILEHRKYFGGGTTEMTTCFGDKPWVARKEASLHARLEDGSIAIRSILALRCAIGTHQTLFGGMSEVSKHTSWLAKILYDRLESIRHVNGVHACHIYNAPSSTYGDPTTQGATVALNFRKCDGSWIGPYAVGAMLRSHNIHTRTGSLCNPAGMACALNLSPANLKRAFDDGFRCNQQDDVREGGMLFAMVRITLGAMSTLEDVAKLVTCIEERIVNYDHAAKVDSNESEKLKRNIDRQIRWDKKADGGTAPLFSLIPT